MKRWLRRLWALLRGRAMTNREVLVMYGMLRQRGCDAIGCAQWAGRAYLDGRLNLGQYRALMSHSASEHAHSTIGERRVVGYCAACWPGGEELSCARTGQCAKCKVFVGPLAAGEVLHCRWENAQED